MNGILNWGKRGLSPFPTTVDAKSSAQAGASGRAMSRLAKVFVLFVSLIGLGAWSGDALAIAKFARITGNWGTAGTWSSVSCALAGATVIPTAADAVTICPGVIVTMNSNPGAALSLVVNGTANWAQARTTNVGVGGITIPAGGNITGAVAGKLTSTGGLTINATLTSTTVTITLQTTAAQTISGTGSLARLTVTGAGVTATNTGTLTVSTALAGTGRLTNTGTLNIGGTSAITNFTANAVGNTVNYSGAGQTIKAPTGAAPLAYHHLQFSGSGAKAIAATTINGDFTMSGTATTAPTGTLTVLGNFTIGAVGNTFTAGALAHAVGGNWSNSGTFTAVTSTVTLTGTNSTLGGSAATTFNNLTINKTANNDVTINSASAALSPTVNGVLTLTSGHVFTTVGTNDLGMGTAGTVPGGGSAASHVVGDMQKNFLTGNSSFTFPIGDGTNYQPVTVALTGVTTAGALNAHVDSGDHPDTIANISGIDQTNSANHYWTLTPGTLAGGTYTATFQFCSTITCSVPAERDTLVPAIPNTPPNNFIVARKYPVATGSWVRPTVSTITANTILTTGGVTSPTGFGVFAVGIPLAGVYKGVNQLIDLREVY